jgi:hypothetical protein
LSKRSKDINKLGVPVVDQSRASSRLPNWTGSLDVQISALPTHYFFWRRRITERQNNKEQKAKANRADDLKHDRQLSAKREK